MAAGMMYRVLYLQNERQVKPAEFALLAAVAGLLVSGILKCALWGFITANLYRFGDYYYRKKGHDRRNVK